MELRVLGLGPLCETLTSWSRCDTRISGIRMEERGVKESFQKMLHPLSRTQSPSHTQLQSGWKALLLKPRVQ